MQGAAEPEIPGKNGCRRTEHCGNGKRPPSHGCGIGNVIIPLEAARDRYALIGRREDVSIFVYEAGKSACMVLI